MISASTPAAILDSEILVPQSEYARRLRPLLPNEAFQANRSTLPILFINLAILILGWGMARQIPIGNLRATLLFLPFALIMGNSVAVLLFGSHDLMHGKTIRHPLLRHAISLISWTLFWMPPSLWKAIHNREHHNKTNSEQDPDRNYRFQQPHNWGMWFQHLFVPSVEVNPFWLAVGMTSTWGLHNFKNLTSIVLFNNGATRYPVFSFQVSAKERRFIAMELAGIAAIHASIIGFIGLRPEPLLLGYFLPIWIGYSIVMAYIYTNHMACRMTDVNDPLINSISLKVPKILDTLHCNFSHHTEHHIFPGMNSDYYPEVQKLLLELYPERFNLLDARQAWKLLMQTPRYYLNANTFTNICGESIEPCPLSAQARPHA